MEPKIPIHFPQEIKWEILLFLELCDFPNLFSVDKDWNCISKNDTFWKDVASRDEFFVSELNRKKEKDKSQTYLEMLKFYYSGYFNLRRLGKYKSFAKKNGSHLCKVLFIGSYESRKTRIINVFADTTKSVGMGIDFRLVYLINLKTYPSKKKEIRLLKCQLWDVAADQRFVAITNSNYRNVSGFVFCFNIDDISTFNDLEMCWKQKEENLERYKTAIEKPVSILIGWKKEGEIREVSDEKARKWALEKKIRYFEISKNPKINLDNTIIIFLGDV